MNDREIVAKRLAASGAALFAVGILTGVRVSISITDHEAAVIQHMVLSAHLNALLGGLWLIAIAATFAWLHFDAGALRRMAILASVPAWSNWLISLIASRLGVYGLEHTTDRANNMVSVGLKIFVLVPSILTAGLWLWGFTGKRGTAQSADSRP